MVNTISKPEEVVFNGVAYKLMGAKRYYLSQSRTDAGRKGAKGLHVAIWEFYNHKKVPSGYCIHHKDGNPLIMIYTILNVFLPISIFLSMVKIIGKTMNIAKGEKNN